MSFRFNHDCYVLPVRVIVHACNSLSQPLSQHVKTIEPTNNTDPRDSRSTTILTVAVATELAHDPAFRVRSCEHTA